MECLQKAKQLVRKFRGSQGRQRADVYGERRFDIATYRNFVPGRLHVSGGERRPPRPTSHCQLVCKASQGTLSQTSQIRVPIINILQVDPVHEYHRPGIKAFEYLGSLVETLSLASSALRHQDRPNLHRPATEDVVRKLEPISQVISNRLELLEANFAQHQASLNPHGPSADGETAKSLGCQMSIAECDHIVSEMPDRKHEKGVREYSK